MLHKAVSLVYCSSEINHCLALFQFCNSYSLDARTFEFTLLYFQNLIQFSASMFSMFAFIIEFVVNTCQCRICTLCFCLYSLFKCNKTKSSFSLPLFSLSLTFSLFLSFSLSLFLSFSLSLSLYLSLSLSFSILFAFTPFFFLFLS